MTIEDFVQFLLGLAGLDPSGVIDLSQRLAAEIADRKAKDTEFLDLVDFAVKHVLKAGADDVAFADAAGRIVALVGKSGLALPGLRLQPMHALLGDNIPVTDPAGRIAAYLYRGDGFTEAEIAAHNDRAMAQSASLRLRLNTVTASLGWALNQFMGYGQSLMASWETFPVKTTTGRDDVLMLGQSTRPGGNHNATSATPLGDTVLRTAVATAQRQDTGALLDAAQQAALPAGDTALGEDPLVAACIFARQLQLQHLGVRALPERRFVLTNCAVGGKTVERLSKGASPELFNRLRTMTSAVKTAAAGSSHGLAAVLYMQGEDNYVAANGGTTDKATYKTLLRQLRADIQADLCTGITGQTEMPAFITYQTGGGFTVDATDLSIGEAQFELSLENQGWYLAAPSYPVTDKGFHLDANGARWLACQFGKAIHEVVTLRRVWRPLSPLAVVARGRTVLASFHLPSGTPLQFQDVWVGNEAKSYPAAGFTIIDAVGGVPITGVRIAAPAVVELALARPLVGAANLYYGRQTEANGGGNLCDSDPTIAPFNYEYAAGSGDYASANIPALVGKPYPLWNWCVAFKRPIAMH
ncbi:MAG: sialate O-acetylesterase [Methylobacteriaceae bacterium]